MADVLNAPTASAARKWSVSWGWNHSSYSNNDIHFWGRDHDFTIRDVLATDIQTDPTWANLFGIYLRPSDVTIPQTNFRVAYQFAPDMAVALNLDHMKYVMLADQTVPIEGQILGARQTGFKKLTTDYLNFEHTDGLNIVSVELEKQYKVDWFGGEVPARVFGLAGVGILVPKTNVTLNMLGRARNDQFHVSGFSAGVGAGLEVDFCKDFFFRTAYKYGHVNMPDVLTSSEGDKAQHQFNYNEVLLAAGWRF